MPYHIPEVDRMIRPDAEQPRIVSIRECARAQGFRDYDQFYGSTDRLAMLFDPSFRFSKTRQKKGPFMSFLINFCPLKM